MAPFSSFLLSLLSLLQLAIAQSMSGNATYSNPILDGVGADP